MVTEWYFKYGTIHSVHIFSAMSTHEKREMMFRIFNISKICISGFRWTLAASCSKIQPQCGGEQTAFALLLDCVYVYRCLCVSGQWPTKSSFWPQSKGQKARSLGARATWRSQLGKSWKSFGHGGEQWGPFTRLQFWGSTTPEQQVDFGIIT